MNSIQKIYIITGLIIAMIVLMIGVLVLPLTGEIRQTSGLTLEENQKLLAMHETDIDYLKEIENNYKKIKDEMGVFKVYLNDDQTVEFIKELESRANSLSGNLEIKSANFPGFNLSWVGGFADFMKFLGWLESSPYLVDIESVQVKKITETDFSSEEAKLFSVENISATLQIKLPTKKHESE